MLPLKDLVDGNGVWQLNSVQAFLPEPILHEISSTSIFLTVGTDMLVWKPNRTGSFSVKSTWQAIRCRRADLWFSRPEAPLYKLLWQLYIPKKISFHCLRAIVGRLPVDAAIRAGIPVQWLSQPRLIMVRWHTPPPGRLK